LRRKSIRKILFRIWQHKKGEMGCDKLLESFQGWQAYAKWADTYKLRRNLIKQINHFYHK